MPPQSQPPQFQVGDAIGYGWTKFRQNLGPILIAMLIFVIIGAVLYLIQQLVAPNTTVVETDNGTTVWRTTSALGGILSLIMAVVMFVWNYVVEAAIGRGGLAVTEGRQIELGNLLTAQKLGRVILAGVILSILIVIGLILCIIPGLLVAIFGSFFVYFILDQDQGAWESIKSSFALVKEHFGKVLGLLILTWLITLVGALLCGVGLFVAIPVVAIAKAYAYKVLRGQPVAA